MLTMVKKWVLSAAMSIINRNLDVYEAKTPEIREFRKALYEMPIPKFMEYLMEKMAKEDLDSVTFPEYIKKLIEPLNDEVENIIDGAIDSLKPLDK